ncbi:MAG: hypothetical protein M1556_01450 [Candidatus Thermoplasmatota archaeon]|jgi:hypothetical protein|nr:hypothetical protein [Candidatus Thermoplasmatota archaeon]MCL6002301.1 hypothetical protein [Candidatus Thermoplasmatota archaeon]
MITISATKKGKLLYSRDFDFDRFDSTGTKVLDEELTGIFSLMKKTEAMA